MPMTPVIAEVRAVVLDDINNILPSPRIKEKI